MNIFPASTSRASSVHSSADTSLYESLTLRMSAPPLSMGRESDHSTRTDSDPTSRITTSTGALGTAVMNVSMTKVMDGITYYFSGKQVLSILINVNIISTLTLTTNTLHIIIMSIF